MEDVIVVGAGITGLAAARILRRAGLKVKLLEKSRGVGGRLATRRVETPYGTVSVDHGAQYFTCRSDTFRAFLAPLIAQKEVAVWIESVPTLKADGSLEAASAEHRSPRYVCPAGMSTLAKHLAQDLQVLLEHRVQSIAPTDSGHWQVHTENGACEEARAVLLTAPPAQSLVIADDFADDPAFAPASTVDFQPCLALIAGYGPVPPDKLPVALRWEDDPILAWSAVDSSKRLHPVSLTLVLHAQPEFSHQFLEADSELTTGEILHHCAKRLAPYTPLDLAQPEWVQLHRWRDAMPDNPLKENFLAIHTPAPLLMAGCWCAGARVEGAFVSGEAAGRALLQCLDR